jgi:putative flavoprotein involved in K+ transport
MLDKSLAGRTQAFLDGFGAALAQNDIAKAREMFQDDCYWRDLVTFTWNIKTIEGKDQVEDMLKHQLATTKPSNWLLAEGEIPTEEDGVTTAWIQFETETARGYGLMRLKDGKIWTLLTTMVELKGFEEPAGFKRPLGAKHGAGKNRETWKEEREREAAELGYKTQPYCLIIGGGQGGIALGARLRQLGVPTIIIEKNDRPGDSWRKRYKSLCLHDPVWYDHLPYMQVPRELAGLCAQGQDRRLARNVYQGHGAELLDPHHGQIRQLRREDGGMDRHRGSRRRRSRAAAQAACHGDRHVRQERMPDFPGMDKFKGEQQHSSEAPGPTSTGQEGRRRRLEQLSPRHLRRALGTRRGRDHGAAVLHPYRAVGHADGDRPRRALLRRSCPQRHDDRKGRSDLSPRCPIGSCTSSRSRPMNK